LLFTEPSFLLLFLPLVLALYYATPSGGRNHVLALASLAFYAIGEWAFLPWFMCSTAVSYVVAILCDRWRGQPRARVVLVLGIVTDLGLLVIFKYAGFLAENLSSLLTAVGLHALPVPTIALPLGISFFTFHKISYKVDVARGVAIVRKNPLDLLLYITLFPQLIAGPIVRYHDIAEELEVRQQRLDLFAAGVRRFILGMAKKMLIANAVALCATRVFALPSEQLSGSLAWLGIACYTIQIYADFSGYSDMAIGLALMFGFHFPENFRYPYVATSITEFWRRWHISLSSWFRDYLYIPLGGNRVSPGRTYANLMIVFVLCGFWHGASWNFLIWGIFHGGLQIVERLGVGALLLRLPRVLRHVYTMVLVMIGWVFFRADTLTQALAFLRSMFGFGPAPGFELTPAQLLTNDVAAALVIGTLISMPLLPWISGAITRYVDDHKAAHVDFASRLFALVALLAILFVGATEMAGSSYNPFIYFRF
jgi:alginate O-acetyltransferase complex protein AlgI